MNPVLYSLSPRANFSITAGESLRIMCFVSPAQVLPHLADSGYGSIPVLGLQVDFFCYANSSRYLKITPAFAPACEYFWVVCQNPKGHLRAISLRTVLVPNIPLLGHW